MDGVKTDEQGTEICSCNSCGKETTRFEGETYALCKSCAWQKFQEVYV